MQPSPGMDPGYAAYLAAQQQAQAQPQYPTAPQPTYAPPAAPATYGAPEPDPFSDPSGGQGGGLKPRNLVGRTVIIQPISIDEAAVFEGASRPSAIANVTVVDGGPIMYGDNEKTKTPYTHSSQIPAVFNGVMFANSELVKACRPALAERAIDPSRGILVGKIVIGTKGNHPFLLETLDPKTPEGQQRRAAAVALYQQIRMGTFINPVPVDLAPGTGLPAQPQAYPTGPPTFQGMPPYGPPQHAPAYAPQPVPAAPPVDPGYAAYLASQQAAQPVSAPAAQPAASSLPPAPVGFDPSMWAQLPEAARQQIMAQRAAQPQPAPAGPSY